MTAGGSGDAALQAEPRAFPSNPFASRYTKPGTLPPLDAQGRPLAIGPLLDRVHRGCSVIEGPHGRGKTTLVRALLAAATAAGRSTSFIQVRSWADARGAVAALAAARRDQIVAVDGWEQLPWGCDLLITALARWRGACVIATAHRSSRLPVLARCESSPAIITALVERLPDHGGAIGSIDIDAAFRDYGGNIRDALAALYDRFEERRSSRAARET
jgi:hypothetical protein